MVLTPPCMFNPLSVNLTQQVNRQKPVPEQVNEFRLCLLSHAAHFQLFHQRQIETTALKVPTVDALDFVEALLKVKDVEVV